MHEYLKAEQAPTLSSLAASLGVSVGRLSQLRRSTKWPARLALKLEQATGGAINAAVISEIVAECRHTA